MLRLRARDRHPALGDLAVKWIEDKIMALNDWLWPKELEAISFFGTAAIIGWFVALIVVVVSILV